MKYVIFENEHMYLPVTFPDHVTHSEVKIKGATPRSAGFFHYRVMAGVCTYSRSESLNLEPHKDDEKILTYAMENAGTMFFMKMNYEDES